MKKRSIKSMLSMMLCASMVFGSVSGPVAVQAEESSTEAVTETASVSIYPKPQSAVIDSEEGMTLDGAVDVIVHGEQDVATLPKLEAFLQEEGISYEYKDAVGENAAIVLATACEDAACVFCTGLEDSEAALEKEQGYVLKSSNEANEKGQITIVGADADGTYYGVMSMFQMFEQKTSDGRIAEVTVSDYPDVPFRGYVEGFYGIPWSFEDRADLFRDTTLYKMTTYIYAPKDDKYHRKSWRTLYPEAEAANIKELAKIAAENNMEFCWTIHPGADYDYTTDADGNGLVDDYEAILAKFDQVYSLGVRQFGVFYDDLDYDVANGSQHASVLNDAYAYLQDKYGDVKPFITVVTRYTNSWGAPWDTYFTPFMQELHEDTIVLWTGQSTMSAITKAYMEVPKTKTGVDRDFGVWWNYPVNDYCDGHLLMSPLHCLSNDVDNICSFFLNPMSEADASKVAIYSGADYSWNIADFDSQYSWSRAIEELVPEANEEFERFADNIGRISKGNGFEFDESVYLKDEFASFEAVLADKEKLPAEVANLKMRFEQMLTDAEALRTIENAALLDEITNHLDAYEALGKAGVAAMEGFEAAMNAEIEGTIGKIAEMKAFIAECQTYRTPILNGKAQAYVGTYRIIPFLNNLEEKMMGVLNNSFAVTRTAKFVTNVSGLAAEIVPANGGYSVSDLTAVMNAGDYVAIMLPKAANLYDVEAAVAPAENFKLQYSLNGIEWFDWSDEIVTGTYGRILCTVDGTDAAISSFSVSPAYEPLVPVVFTDMPTYKTYNIGKALDGDATTLFWSSAGSVDGNYIAVDMGSPAVLGEIQFYSGVNKHGVVDAYLETQLEVSMDGDVWTPVGDPKPLSDFVDIENDTLKRSILTIDAGDVTARYFRLKAIGASESWLMAYEILYDADYLNYEDRTAVSTNLYVYEDYTVDKAMDNSVGTYLWCYDKDDNDKDVGCRPGDYVQVDLGTVVPLYDASVFFGKNTKEPEYFVDGFSITKLQTSLDGETWIDVGSEVDMDDYVEADGLYQVTIKGDGSMARYLRFVSCEEYKSWAKVYEVKYNQSISSIRNVTPAVSTNMKVYQNNAITNAIDGDMSSKFYSSAATSAGDYVQVDFGSAISLYDAAIYFGGSPNDDATAIDGFGSTKLQISNDNKTWTDIGDVMANTDYEIVGGRFLASFDAAGVSARYVRFTAASAVKNWCQVYEIQFNKSVDSNAVRFTEGTVKMNQSDYLDDGKLSTAPAIYEVDNGDTLIYPMTTVTNVASIGIYQEPSFISNAQVSVENIDGTWTDIGTLDSVWKLFEINAEILSVKLTFDGSVQPVIYEIIVTGVETPAGPKAADYSAVKAALAKVPADLGDYTDETVAVLNAAIEAVDYTLDETMQEEVNAMAKAIEDAIAGLEEIVFAIVTQPKNASAITGQEASIFVEATGKGLTYTWYYKNPGNKKFYVSNSQFVSEGGSVYSIPMVPFRDGQQVYCLITDANGDVLITNSVVLSVYKGGIEIIKQPESMEAAKGEQAVVTVEAKGDNLSYTWYYKNPGNKKFYESGESFVSEDGASYSIPMSAWRDGQQVYCVITDATGAIVQTNTVTLTLAK